MISQKYKYLAAFSIALCLAVVPSWIAWGGWLPQNRTAGNAEIVAQTAANSQSFGLPIDCSLGQECFVMLYPDRDPGPEAVDFGCGRQTYDTHKGTDFAIRSDRQMAAGVKVQASASGRVLRIRDGVVDRRVQNEADIKAVDGIECGNAVVIDHGDGWESQYCHLRNGSVIVKPGDEVQKGTVLGMVGASGLASFPHVHLSIRYQGEVVDPFVGPNAAPGCNVPRNSIWEEPLDYLPTGLIRAGFAPELPNMEKLWQGSFSEKTLSKDIPLMIFWIQTYGTLQGDKVHFKLTAPNGEVMAENEQILEKPNRTWMGYVGKRNTQERPIIPGQWQGEYQLMRGDRILIEVDRSVEVR